MTYITNQYGRQVYQFETEIHQEGPKPIYLKTLTRHPEVVKQGFGVPGGRRPSHLAGIL